MKKSKFLKPFSFASLALLMGAGGVFAFAPLCAGAQGGALASASEMVESTTEQGLITPKADDPVIYTTESGLEIYAGQVALSKKIPAPTCSGVTNPNTNLNTFPYFITQSETTIYYWTIIGQSSSESIFTFSNDPASKAIQAEALYPIISNPEIPSGCVLCLCNTIVESSTYNSNGGYYGGGELSNRTACSLANLGLSSLNIQAVSVSKRVWDGTVTTSSLKVFTLGGVQSTFNWSTYLTSAQVKLSSNFWTGDNYSSYRSGYINTSGSYTTGSGTCGIRPAFVLGL